MALRTTSTKTSSTCPRKVSCFGFVQELFQTLHWSAAYFTQVGHARESILSTVQRFCCFVPRMKSPTPTRQQIVISKLWAFTKTADCPCFAPFFWTIEAPGIPWFFFSCSFSLLLLKGNWREKVDPTGCDNRPLQLRQWNIDLLSKRLAKLPAVSVPKDWFFVIV